MLKKMIFVLSLFLVVFLYGEEKNPVIDGDVSPSEYQQKIECGKGMELYITITGNKLFLAAKAKTTGWISIGLGSKVMDKADLFIGYVKGGKSSFIRSIGVNHSHKIADSTGVDSFVVKETGGYTYIEFSLDRGKFIKAGAVQFPVLVGYSKKDDFKSRHKFRKSLTVKIK